MSTAYIPLFALLLSFIAGMQVAILMVLGKIAADIRNMAVIQYEGWTKEKQRLKAGSPEDHPVVNC